MSHSPMPSELRQVSMGLGAAILRLMQVDTQYRQGRSAVPEEALREKDLIVQALNQFTLDIGFDCNADGLADVPITVDIFQVAAQTSCCRIPGKDNSRVPPAIVQAPLLALVPPPVPSPPAKSRGQTRGAPATKDTKPTVPDLVLDPPRGPVKPKKKGFLGLFSGDTDK